MEELRHPRRVRHVGQRWGSVLHRSNRHRCCPQDEPLQHRYQRPVPARCHVRRSGGCGCQVARSAARCAHVSGGHRYRCCVGCIGCSATQHPKRSPRRCGHHAQRCCIVGHHLSHAEQLDQLQEPSAQRVRLHTPNPAVWPTSGVENRQQCVAELRAAGRAGWHRVLSAGVPDSDSASSCAPRVATPAPHAPLGSTPSAWCSSRWQSPVALQA